MADGQANNRTILLTWQAEPNLDIIVMDCPPSTPPTLPTERSENLSSGETEYPQYD